MKPLITFLLLATFSSAYCQLSSPVEFFNFERGDRFSSHHEIVSYFRHVAANSPLVKIQDYGETNQGRPLIVAFISSPSNLEYLSDIRTNNMRMTGLYKGDLTSQNPPSIVWISCSVHGNEAAGTESSPEILWQLVNPNNKESKKWLENTVVVIDPCINPDGYSRYTNWARDVAGNYVNKDIDDSEHQEPWPGGRVNHYMFDLNRDWAWQTQIESQQRLRLYNEWMPHIHVDLHEMGSESPYYFAPAAKPYHEYITKWQKDFQKTIGLNHAKYFDKEGWLYYTKEVFDLLYPSYGDTYPVFNGAIGMTYEQGGSHRGGRALTTLNGESLTLKDRIAHHVTTSLSTIEIGALHQKEVVNNFKKYWTESSNNPKGKYKSYYIKADPTRNRIKALCELFRKLNIQYSEINTSKSVKGFNYLNRKEGSLGVKQGDIFVSSLQPKSILTQVLLDPITSIEDSLTYDITAWSLPYAYGLEAIASTVQQAGSNTKPKFKIKNSINDEFSYAYIMEWGDIEGVKLLADFAEEKIDTRLSTKSFKLNGKEFKNGNIVITQADNRSMDSLAYKVKKISDSHNAIIHSVSTGFVESDQILVAIK